MKSIGKLNICIAAIVMWIPALWFPSELRGQPQTTKYQTLVTNSTALTATFGPVMNIGQSFHQVQVTLNGGGGCSQGNTDIKAAIYGSSLNTFSTATASKFSLPVSALTSDTTILIQGAGAYPFIYVTIAASTLAGCNYTVQYSGTIQPIQPQSNIQQTLEASQIDGHSLLLMGTSTIIVPVAGTKGFDNIYQLTMTTDVTTKLTITCVSSTAVWIVNLLANDTKIFPFTGVRWFTCPTDSAINGTVSAMANVDIKFQYVPVRGT